MNVPSWVKLAAASKEEILNEVLATIDELGGLEEAQNALRQSSGKKSNWVLHEKFVTAEKSLEEILKEDAEKARKDFEDNKIIQPVTEGPRANPEIPSLDVSEEKPKRKRKKQDQQQVSESGYLATLLGILMGISGTLSYQQLQNIDLKKAIATAVANETKLNNQFNEWLQNQLGNKGLPKVKVPKDLANQPAPLPSEITPAEESELPGPDDTTVIPKEIGKDDRDFNSQVRMREEQIKKEKDSQRKEDLEKDLDDFIKQHSMDDQ